MDIIAKREGELKDEQVFGIKLVRGNKPLWKRRNSYKEASIRKKVSLLFIFNNNIQGFLD